MSSIDKSEYVHGVFSNISHSYDLMNDLESLGLHRLWKAQLVRELSQVKPESILDIACGTGDIAIALALANPKAKVVGLDFNEDMLEVARRRVASELPLSFIVEIEPPIVAEAGEDMLPQAEAGAEAEALSETEDCPKVKAPLSAPQPSKHKGTQAKSTNNLNLVVGNAMELPFANESFDAVSISFGLRNMPDYAAVLEEIYRVLRPGGSFCCLEASYPTNKLVKPPFKLYFKHWLPVLGKLVVGSSEEYSWLNTSTEAFLSKDELAQLMQNTGFKQVSYSSYMLGAAALHRGMK